MKQRRRVYLYRIEADDCADAIDGKLVVIEEPLWHAGPFGEKESLA